MSTISVDLQNTLSSTKNRIYFSLCVAIATHLAAALCFLIFFPPINIASKVASTGSITVKTVNSSKAHQGHLTHPSSALDVPSTALSKPTTPSSNTISDAEKNDNSEAGLQSRTANSVQDSTSQTVPSETFGALPVPKKLLGRGIFPRKYSVSWSCNNSTSYAKLKTFVSEDEPKQFVDETLQEEFAKLLAHKFGVTEGLSSSNECTQRTSIVFTENE